jgi:hypothetical protein
VNANHARPLLAFCALAVAAAIITGAGLSASTRNVTVSAGRPAPVQTSGAPELVLGGTLRAESGRVLSNPLAPDLWSSLAGGATASGGVQVAAPTRTPRAVSHATARPQPDVKAGGTSGGTKTAVTAAAKPRKDPPGHTKATATARPTGRGKGSDAAGDHAANGKGH